MSRGLFVLIIGPPAVGKTTIVDELLKELPEAIKLVTTTSRPPRPGEKDGVDYHFVAWQEFERLIAESKFLEWAEIYGNLYGSSAEKLDELLPEHPFVFGIIDVEGARQIKKKRPSTCAIFVRPGSRNELAKRLRKREGVDPQELECRLEAINEELSADHEFDYVVVNREGGLHLVIGAIQAILKDQT